MEVVPHIAQLQHIHSTFVLVHFKGHSNQVVDPTVAHHQLTYDEAMSLGWIFHVTDFIELRIHSTIRPE